MDHHASKSFFLLMKVPKAVFLFSQAERHVADCAYPVCAHWLCLRAAHCTSSASTASRLVCRILCTNFLWHTWLMFPYANWYSTNRRTSPSQSYSSLRNVCPTCLLNSFIVSGLVLPIVTDLLIKHLCNTYALTITASMK